MRPRVPLRELKRDSVQPVSPVAHRQRREDASPHEFEFVPQRARLHGRRRLAFERDECAQDMRRMLEVVVHHVPAPRDRARCVRAVSERRERRHHRETHLAVGMLDVPAKYRDRRRSADLAPDANERLLRATAVIHRRAGPPRRPRARRRRLGRARPRPRPRFADRRGGLRLRTDRLRPALGTPRAPRSRRGDRDRRAAHEVALGRRGLPASYSPSMTAATARSSATSDSREAETSAAELLPRRVVVHARHRECDCRLHHGVGVAEVRGDSREGRQADPAAPSTRMLAALTCGDGSSRQSRAASAAISGRKLHEPFERVGADVHAFVDDEALQPRPATRDAVRSSGCRVRGAHRARRRSPPGGRSRSRLLSLSTLSCAGSSVRPRRFASRLTPYCAVQEYRDDHPGHHDHVVRIGRTEPAFS